MAENLTKAPKRGILKASTSFEQREADPSRTKNSHFDESNILATLHPPDKDYGFMKIEEPKTPYEYASGAEDDEPAQVDGNSGNGTGGSQLDANLLASRIAFEAPKKNSKKKQTPKQKRTHYVASSDGYYLPTDEEGLKLLTPEQEEKRKQFEEKRKAHYNEYQRAKMARQLRDSDDESEKETEGNGSSSKISASLTGSVKMEVQSSTSFPEKNANTASLNICNSSIDTKDIMQSTISKGIDTNEENSIDTPMDTSNSSPLGS